MRIQEKTIKILHTADIHLGMYPDKGRPWSEERHDALWNVLRRMVQAAEDETDLLLIAGDLFHRQPLLRELKEVNALFQTLSHARVVLIAGNHDCVTPRSRYLDFPWAPSVSFLMGGTEDSVFFEDLNTQVHGFSYRQTEIREPLYDRIKAPCDGRIHILLAHGGDEKHIPVNPGRPASNSFHYAAFGHIHKPELREDLRLAWCGSPEPLDCSDTGVRGYVRAEVSLNQTCLRFVPACTARYIPLTVSVQPDTTREGLAHSLARTMQAKGLSHLYQITLLGERELDMDFGAAPPLPGRVASWNDQTHISLDYERLRALHDRDLLGYFLAQADTLPPGELRDKVIAYGVRACLTEGGRP